MTALRIAGLVTSIIFGYSLGGSLTVLATAYLHKRITGKRWFSDDYDKRWTDDGESALLPPPATIFGLWFLALPAYLVGFIISGFFTVTERLGDKLLDLADSQRKQIGDYRENPK